MHVAVYAGVPAANHALKIVKQTLAEMEGGGGSGKGRPLRGGRSLPGRAGVADFGPSPSTLTAAWGGKRSFVTLSKADFFAP